MTPNDYFVESTRFSLTNKNTFVIRGWFRDDNPENRSVVIEIDGNVVESLHTVKSGVEVRQRYLSYRANVSEEHTYEIPLPVEIEDIKAIKIYSILSGDDGCILEKNLVEKVPKSILKRQKNNILYQIENQSYYGETKVFSLTGWALDDENVVISLRQRGKEITSEMSRNYRKDVMAVFPEVKSDINAGFKIEAVIQGGTNDISLILQTNNKQTIIKVHTKDKKGKISLLDKTINYLSRYGLLRTVKKAFRKLFSNNISLEKVRQDEYKQFRKKYEITKQQLEEQTSLQKDFEYSPVFGIVIPLYETNEKYLLELINSIKNQTYDNWRIYFADGSRTNHLAKFVDEKIRYNFLPENLGISDNTNSAINMALNDSLCDYIVLADHDDLLAPNALFECAKTLQGKMTERPDVIYSDEDKIDLSGKKYFEPHFKSDYNVDLLCSMNYICHLFVVKKELIEQLISRDGAALRKEFDGAQDHDFIFRCCEIANQVYHIPKILYHWRCSINSTALNPESKLYAFEAGRKAVEGHYKRINVPAKVDHGQFYGIYRTKYEWKEQPLISIIIPNKDHIDDLKKCMESIETRSTYRNFEFIIVENNSTEKRTFDYYNEIRDRLNVNVIYYEPSEEYPGFNFSRINNIGAEHANGDYLLLLNNDTELIKEDGLWELLSPCMRDDVGIVGAKLYYDDDTIQHGGVVLGFGGMAGHAFIGQSRYDNGYFNRAICAQDLSAVTAACMLIKKSVFELVGGLTESFEVAFNDIDLCMKVREAGYLIIYNPAVELYHYESKSRGLEDTPGKVERFNSEVARFIERWNLQLLAGDPYYNRNLTLDKADYSLRE